jgi:tRNA (cytidine32/uridine32-2'-O)-methyltransferase|tara:strand:- start:1025 stop:1786 length:762 start_codon:yes stop_codon:yes gene_type:complete
MEERKSLLESYSNSIKFVLVGTTHPGNIGASARAIKNMGFNKLSLVDPKDYPNNDALYRAKAAKDVLENSEVHDHLSKATKNCQLIIGTSARNRKVPWPVVSPKQAGREVANYLNSGSKEIAIVFGREDRGLTNEELGMCNLHVHIPTDEDYSSLNLSQAVQILSYELRLAMLSEEEVDAKNEWDVELANSDQTERLINHMDELMQEVEFYDTQNPRKLLTRVRRFFKRSQIDVMEANIFRGLFSAIQKRMKD